MLEEMEKSTGGDTQNSAQKFYKSLIRKEHAQALTGKNQNLGIQDIILDEVYPEKFRTKQQYEAYLKTQKQSVKR